MTAVLRTSCGGCGSADLAEFLDLGRSPLADRFPLPGEPDGPSIPLRVAVCQECWLAQLLDNPPDADLFGDDYGFMTGSSPALAGYFARWARWALAEYPGQAEAGVIEIACNDGTLLRHFAAAGVPALGIEPAGPPARAAVQAGLDVEQAPFTAALAGTTARAGLVIACNVAAHVDDPRDFLEGIRALLRPGGVAIAEFQYLGDLIAGMQFDHVYHEHRYFYSLGSFARLAAGAGLRVTRVLRTPNQGGSLRVVLASEARPIGDAGGLVALESHLRSPGAYSSMQARADYSRGTLVAFLDAEMEDGRTVAGYGASAKSATLLNFCGLDRKTISWVEDLTPGKIGRETPGTRIPIIAPADGMKPDTYLLLAWNYLSAVVRRERDFLSSGGRLIVPGPIPLVI
ncbi:MAG: class I SAM-dependent methyltransferase [Actinomycetota bacterium]|nr:class I SAM-dependent methyltransferase [Actinomycetota bacterium]